MPDQVQVIVGTKVLDVTLTSETEVKFNFPQDLPYYFPFAGYPTFVNLINRGYAGTFNSFVVFEITSFSPKTGSRGGQNIVIQGSGFRNKNDT